MVKQLEAVILTTMPRAVSTMVMMTFPVTYWPWELIIVALTPGGVVLSPKALHADLLGISLTVLPLSTKTRSSLSTRVRFLASVALQVRLPQLVLVLELVAILKAVGLDLSHLPSMPNVRKLPRSLTVTDHAIHPTTTNVSLEASPAEPAPLFVTRALLLTTKDPRKEIRVSKFLTTVSTLINTTLWSKLTALLASQSLKRFMLTLQLIRSKFSLRKSSLPFKFRLIP
jgi:hypothetical protein